MYVEATPFSWNRPIISLVAAIVIIFVLYGIFFDDRTRKGWLQALFITAPVVGGSIFGIGHMITQHNHYTEENKLFERIYGVHLIDSNTINQTIPRYDSPSPTVTEAYIGNDAEPTTLLVLLDRETYQYHVATENGEVLAPRRLE